MNNKSTFVAALVCGLVLAALIERSGGILLLAAPFLVYLVIGILECPTEMALSVKRTVDKAEAVAQQPIGVQIAVENQGRPLTNLCVADSFPPPMTLVSGTARQIMALSTGDTRQLEYAASAERGFYVWDKVRVTASDPCGLFELRRDFAAAGQTAIRPATISLHRVRIQPRSTLHAAGPTAARLAGPGTDFWGVREYRAGDSLQRLNWRLVGRHPRQLFTNEYQREEIADFGFILDARRLTRAYEAEEALFEACVSATASLAETFLNKGNRVALLIFGEATTVLYPGYGKRQLNLLRRDLAGARLGRNLSLRYLEYFPTRLFPSRSVIVAFSALDPRDLGTYARLRSFGYDVLLVSPDPVEYAGRTLPAKGINDLAIRAARLERAVQLKALAKMDIAVVDWQVNQPLDDMLEACARYMTYRRNL